MDAYDGSHMVWKDDVENNGEVINENCKKLQQRKDKHNANKC